MWQSQLGLPLVTIRSVCSASGVLDYIRSAPASNDRRKKVLSGRRLGGEVETGEKHRRERVRWAPAQMESPKALTMQYMVLFSHRTVQLPVRGDRVKIG